MTNYNKRLAEVKQNNQNLFASTGPTGEGFMVVHDTAIEPGALSTKTKVLEALGIAVALRCEGCIIQHVAAAIKLGAIREEIVETIKIAIMMGGGPSTVYGGKALDCADQFFQSQQDQQAQSADQKKSCKQHPKHHKKDHQHPKSPQDKQPEAEH